MTRFAYFCGHEQWQPEVLVEHAVLAEQAGFDFLVVSEHFHPWVDDTSASGYAFSTIGAMAQATERVEISTGVTTPLFRYHPAVVAQAAATLDRLSGGRFHLGVGTGENLNEGPLGLPFPKYAERAARMGEALQIMRRLLDGEKLDFAGDYYKTDHAKLYSPPVGRVPIWLAAGGPKSAALAARLADGIITSVKQPEVTVERVTGPAGAAAADAGRRPLPVMASRWSIRAENQDEAWEALSAWRGLRAPGRLEAVDPAVLRKRADSMDRDEILSMYSLVSEATDYVEVYRPLITELNADVVTIQTTTLDQPGTIKMLGDEVLPALRALSDS
ncbi:MAG: TIGR03557 family F420-dependent LLM class oxidoreductase [bacterium]|nr:TIGR03557 family F420-dependent LLM class oxidoreductase [bacterium]MCP4968864.1 TIGR03557 family F420-dependent LLM class oxidoreductase [bacterium]